MTICVRRTLSKQCMKSAALDSGTAIWISRTTHDNRRNAPENEPLSRTSLPTEQRLIETPDRARSDSRTGFGSMLDASITHPLQKSLCIGVKGSVLNISKHYSIGGSGHGSEREDGCNFTSQVNHPQGRKTMIVTSRTAYLMRWTGALPRVQYWQRDCILRYCGRCTQGAERDAEIIAESAMMPIIVEVHRCSDLVHRPK